jgi:hypothetical protein
MDLHVVVFLLVDCLLLSLALLWHFCWFPLRPSQSRGGAIHSTAQRLLKPRIPLACPDCRLSCTHSSQVEPVPVPVRPWSEVKSRRGAPKRRPTAGFACPDQQCAYFGITDDRIHALVGDGTHGRAEPIGDLSRSCLPHHVQCSTRHSLVPFENPFPSGRHGTVCGFPKDETLPRPSGSSATDRPRSPPGSGARVSTLKAFTSTFSVISSFPMFSWTNCARGSAELNRCCGSGWPSTHAPRLFPCSIWVLAHKTPPMP